MNTEQLELDEGQSYINQHAKDRLISEDLWDIILCNVKKVISEINEEDLTHLDTYYNFPRKRGVHFLLKSSRQILENELNNHPAFRSQDPITVCLKIANYYNNHPDEIPNQNNNQNNQ